MLEEKLLSNPQVIHKGRYLLTFLLKKKKPHSVRLNSEDTCRLKIKEGLY